MVDVWQNDRAPLKFYSILSVLTWLIYISSIIRDAIPLSSWYHQEYENILLMWYIFLFSIFIELLHDKTMMILVLLCQLNLMYRSIKTIMPILSKTLTCNGWRLTKWCSTIEDLLNIISIVLIDQYIKYYRWYNTTLIVVLSGT